MQFLMGACLYRYGWQSKQGLNDTFEHVRSTRLSIEPFPIVNKAFQMVIQIKRQKDITGGSSGPLVCLNSGSSALAVYRNSGSYRPSNDGRNNNIQSSEGRNSRQSNEERKGFRKLKAEKDCYYCHEKGLIKDSCFKLIGYPDWYK